VAQSFTGEKGWVTVVIDYRLTSDQVFLADAACPDRAHCDIAHATKAAWYPDNIQDVAAAFGWVVSNIGAHGGDVHNLFIFGHSAGGHLASLLVTHPDYVALRPAVRGVISMSGAYVLKNLNMPTFGSDIDQTFHGGHVNNDAELDAASPATYVVTGIALPPYYLLHAQQELPSLNEQTLSFRSRLAALGLPVSYAYLTGYSHTTEMEAIADVAATPTALIVAFIEGILAQPRRMYLPVMLK
jgi:acetyl esterase/lipase